MVNKLALAFVMALAMTSSAMAADLNIVPWPTSVKTGSDNLDLPADCRIVATDKSLDPLANVLSHEIAQVTGVRLATTADKPRSGDIVLELNDKLKSGAYTLDIDQGVIVRGGGYAGAANATATIIQLLQPAQGRPPARLGQYPLGNITLPRLAISDEPFSQYRCLMIDVARQTHSIDTLKKEVLLCRLYKINLMQLHLSDDQAFTFPSTAYPALTTKDRHYTLDELRDLVAFADARGVTIIPEIETPGHSSSMRQVKPFAGPGQGVINMASEETYKALDVLVGEVCDVFKSSPYFHMGADECWLEGVGNTPEEKEYIKLHKLPYAHALYDHFIVRMNEIIRKHGRQTVIWEGFGGKGAENAIIPDNVLVLSWETMYQVPDSLLANGYTIVNATWRPLYIVGDTTRYPEDIYSWNMYLWKNHYRYCPSYIPIQLEPNPKVIGGQMSIWEQMEQTEVPRLRHRLGAMSERIWNPTAGKSFKDFYKRILAIDEKAGLLLTPFKIAAIGLTDPMANGYHDVENWHNQPLKLTLTPSLPGTMIYYTTDGTVPTTASTLAAGEIILSAPVTVLKAKVFDAAGVQQGQMLWNTYHYRPVTATVKSDGFHKHKPNDEGQVDRFESTSTLTVSLTAPRMQGGTLRYSLDGNLTDKSPTYSQPIQIDKDCKFAAAYFDAAGKPVGEPYTRQFQIMDDFVRSLATDKPATSSLGEKDKENPGWVSDGFVGELGFWSGGNVPGWWQVDLQKVQDINKIQVVTYWAGSRYYQYYVEVSTDGKDWKKVIDRTTTTEPATPKGYTGTFDPTPARYVRVTVTKNSDNTGIHLVDVRVFGK